MKGIGNRQKMIVRPRESVQKFTSQQKGLRKKELSGVRNLRLRNEGNNQGRGSEGGT